MNFYVDGIEKYVLLFAVLDRSNIRFKRKKFQLNMQHREYPPTKQSIQKAPQVELKPLKSHPSYVFLGKDYTLPVIIVLDLNVHHAG